MQKLAFLDTDFIIKTSNIKNKSSTLFDEIIQLPFEFRITKKVLSEIRDNEIKNQIISLVGSGKIKTVKNTEIIKELKKIYSEEDCIWRTLDILYKLCNTLWENDEFYNKNFKELEVYKYLEQDVNLFHKKLEEKIYNIPAHNNMGELTTLLNIEIVNIVNEYEVISLLSHDKSARRCVLNMPENIKSYSCFSCFYLLKERLTYEIAKEYVKIWRRENPEQLIETVDKGKKKGIDFLEYLRCIYTNDSCYITRNGLLKID